VSTPVSILQIGAGHLDDAIAAMRLVAADGESFRTAKTIHL
jgi:hypothetical protein